MFYERIPQEHVFKKKKKKMKHISLPGCFKKNSLKSLRKSSFSMYVTNKGIVKKQVQKV